MEYDTIFAAARRAGNEIVVTGKGLSNGQVVK